MTYGLVDELVGIPRTHPFIEYTLQSNIKVLNHILALNPDTASAMKEKASNLSRMGDNYRQIGNTQAALEAYEQSLGNRSAARTD
jgi:hypothetical protein